MYGAEPPAETIEIFPSLEPLHFGFVDIIELEILFPKLVSGGILILDDYGYWSGARKAIDEYFKNTKYWLHYVDPSCRYLIKE